MACVVELENVTFLQGSRTIMDGLSLAINAGETTALMGPSGVGKTTLLKIISGQQKPASGTVRLLGENVYRLRTRALRELRKRLGVLFQQGGLLTDLTVFDNVALPLRENTKLAERMIRDIVLFKLEAVGLRGAIDLYPRELSGGMARRVALARALVLDPELIMYDEPFAGQDPITLGVLMSLISETTEAMGLSAIVVSHDVAEVLSISQYAVLLSEGKVAAEGTPDALHAQNNPFLTQFMQGAREGPVAFQYPASSYRDALLAD